MARYDEIGKIVKEIFFSKADMTQTQTLRLLKEKYGEHLHHRTLKAWIEKHGWETERLQKFMSTEQIKATLLQKQTEFLQAENPSPQHIYAINVLMESIRKQEEHELRIARQNTKSQDSDEITRLMKTRETLLSKIEENIMSGKAAKDQLDELQKLDSIIQSSKKLIRENASEQRVFMFGFDGKDHSEEIENANN